jgi:PIN domain nuclease of toxin-antitoxin system
MRLLLDTHIFLWLDGSPEHLSPTALAACEDPTNQLYLRVVSAWEIHIKHQIALRIKRRRLEEGRCDTL